MMYFYKFKPNNSTASLLKYLKLTVEQNCNSKIEDHENKSPAIHEKQISDTRYNPKNQGTNQNTLKARKVYIAEHVASKFCLKESKIILVQDSEMLYSFISHTSITSC